ncbi:hypothetical protein ASPWEDRAFT_307847 [Aspergillus wentii DTO 134E9]|uniref:Catalase core domain-containing protein n=1 Tax=Aspergillus wentii DTO 134E9 TaxID=1073089 RepID=A0A1L9RT57_ASPWE|nr:uncharacterized protein ASPWEDRAFT_307847 [Aspergillus wentii DTO 134E9]OJJ38038.1 hypothetical protein ASPWEDRAFT_307847 [Aspergillus wentii DTO 134E9]
MTSQPRPQGTQQETSAGCPVGGRIPPPPESRNYFTMPNGCPVEHPLLAERVDKKVNNSRYGSQLIQDLNTVESVVHVSRERIPERVVHAKGVGVFGEFETTNQDWIKKYTDANFLQPDSHGKPKKTRLLSRFSTIAGESGYPDTVRDGKGCAFKLYTEEGNLDWVFLNPEVFNIRDPAKFASLVHAKKRDPATNLLDANMTWDFFNNNIEVYNALMRNLTDEGTPSSYSRLLIASINTYTFTKKKNDTEWDHHLVRIKMLPDPPIDPERDYFTLDEATANVGKDPDYLTRRLYEETQNGPHPTWKVYAQILDPAKTSIDVFDATKVVPETDCPWTEFGKITLNEVPQNYFTQIEQAAFTPANIVPGWDISPDPLLQIRLLSYGDSQRYRLGANHDQLPPNKACSYVYDPTRRNGAYNMTNYGHVPNYLGSVLKTLKTPDHYNISYLKWQGEVMRYRSTVEDVDYKQCREHWDTLDKRMKWHFIYNLGSSLSPATKPVQHETVQIFGKIWSDKYGQKDKNNINWKQELEKELARREKINKDLGKKPGLVPGGEKGTPHYIPGTVPDLSTEVGNPYKRLDLNLN